MVRPALLVLLSLGFVFASTSGLYADKLMASEDIEAAQKILNARGFDPGLFTGTITPATSRALRKFQSQNHLKVTGQLDPSTQAALGVFVRVLESDPVLGVTQEAREAAIRGTKGAENETLRAKPSETK